jgi:hypothetical protein
MPGSSNSKMAEQFERLARRAEAQEKKNRDTED